MSTPRGLSQRGRALWLDLGKGISVRSSYGLLLLEACRCADRLDRLDKILAGEPWAEVRNPDENGVSVLVIDKALGEARLQQNNLRQMLTTLDGLTRPAEKAEPVAPAEGDPDAVDAIAAKRAERQRRTGA